MNRKLSAWMGLAVLAMTVPASLGFGGEGDVVHIGDLAPVISGVATDGSTISLDAYKGKVIVLGFFAMWCNGCVNELPRVDREIYLQYKDAGVAVVEVGRGHSYADLARFKESRGFSFTILADPRRELYTRYATDYIPRSYLIGKDGKVKFAFTGTNESDFQEMKRRVVAELAIPPVAVTPHK